MASDKTNTCKSSKTDLLLIPPKIFAIRYFQEIGPYFLKCLTVIIDMLHEIFQIHSGWNIILDDFQFLMSHLLTITQEQ